MAERKMTKIYPKMTTIQPGGKKERDTTKQTDKRKAKLMPSHPKKEFKRYSKIGLGRGKPGGPGMKPRKEGVPFERGSIGLRKNKRKTGRKAANRGDSRR